MKKIYLFIFTALCAAGMTAQQTLKVKFNTKGADARTHVSQRGGQPGNSPMQIAATITANNPYIAGNTMNMGFTILTTNADLEYIDSIAFTFPATFTVNGSPNATFPTADNGGGAEALNGVNGQTISWGINNNDQYGGIWANPAQTFAINVSVAPGTTGNQVVQYFASGDTYGGTPGDYADSITLVPALPIDLKLLSIKNPGVSCGLGATDTITTWITNYGSDSIKGFTATYIINGGTPVVENAPDTLLPGDTLMYNFATTANFSAPNTYNIWVGATTAGDGNTANDSSSVVAMNYAPANIASSPESMGFEPGADSLAFLTWTIQDVNGDGVKWAPVATYIHTGVRAIRKAASGANDDDWLFTNCLDLQTGMSYRLEYWYKVFDQVAICNLESYVGNDVVNTAMAQLITQDPVPSDTSYHQSVTLFTVSSSGTYHIGFHAYASAGTSSIRVDDINISMSPVGVDQVLNKHAAVYPNPAIGSLSVLVGGANGSVEIYNVIGEKVFTKTQLNKGVNTLDISMLAEGSYVVRVLDGNEVVTKKVIVTK